MRVAAGIRSIPAPMRPGESGADVPREEMLKDLGLA